MTEFDLNRLNDKEFEVLANQIVSRLTGRTVERFKPGKDKGIDGRFFVAGQDEAVTQAKHWARSGYSALVAHLTRTETAKVAVLKPARYFLVTSVPLSRVNKQAIKKLFAPHILTESDILGNEDVQDFLRDHPEVVQQHYKLWLASADILRLIYNAPIIGRSAFKLDQVVAFARKYVKTQCHEHALWRLEQSGAIIIIGEPGIGKSTLAEQLVLHYAAAGYQLCFLENDLTEAEGAWQQGTKQVFYFDDFLGRNYLDVIDAKADSHVVGFMQRVAKDKSKRFILTSRTTIMQQGKRLSELFQASNIDRNEYEVRILDLTVVEKAKILYNHIWFGDLEQAFVEQLYVGRRYQKVVSHRNFNPRLIAFITDSHKIAGIEAEKYWEYILATLENPRDIWRGVFENQLDKMGRLIVSLVVFHGGSITEQQLRTACERARAAELPVPSPVEWRLTFEKSFQMSVGAVITRTIDSEKPDAQVGLFNPSVGDFVLREFAKDENSVINFLSLLQDGDALEVVFFLKRNGLIDNDRVRAVGRGLSARFWRPPFEAADFAALLAQHVMSDGALRKALQEPLKDLAPHFFALSAVTTMPEALSSMGRFSIECGRLSERDDRWLGFVETVIGQTGEDPALVELSQLVVALDPSLQDTATTQLTHHVVECWRDRLWSEINDNNVASQFTDSENDRWEVQKAIIKHVRNTLDDYAIVFSDEHVVAIMDDYSISEHISNNASSQHGRGGEYKRVQSVAPGSGNQEQEIDDLFERDR